MTHTTKIEYIRAKCIEANPWIKTGYTLCEIYDASGTNGIGEKLYWAKIKNGREIRLDDCALIVKDKHKLIDLWVNGDLSKQSDETIAFISEDML